MEALISVATVYFFIVIGFIAKKVFKEKIDEKSFVLLSLYFLQPILIFWGLTRTPINFDLIYTPILYFIIIFTTLGLMYFVDRKTFKDAKHSSIYMASSLVGNTGNLGIPLGIALFGEASVPYTSIINIANVFFIYIFSVYFFAKEQFDLRKSIISILKIPAISFSVLALIFNYNGIKIGADFNRVLEMGAYSAIVLQLIIFGIYMSGVKVREINWKLSIHIVSIKHIILPLIGAIFILNSDISSFIGAILLMQLMTPLAVNNVNLAALYDCKPYDVTGAVVITTLVFIALIYFYLEIINRVFGI